MYVKFGRFRRVVSKGKVFHRGSLELDKDSADFYFTMGLRMLIKKKKAKVVVLTPDEAKKLGVKAKSAVSFTTAEYGACISEAVIEVLKQAVKNKWRPK